MTTIRISRLPLAPYYAARFPYDPELIELLKAVVPHYRRSWNTVMRAWILSSHIDVDSLTATARRHGHMVVEREWDEWRARPASREARRAAGTRWDAA